MANHNLRKMQRKHIDAVKTYRYDLWVNLFVSGISISSGIKVLIIDKNIDILSIIGFVILVILGIYILMTPTKISIDESKIYIAMPFMFPLEASLSDILSIKTTIFLGAPNLIIEFLQREKRRKINIPSLIIGYRELTKKIVEKAHNANIDYKTKAFLRGDLGYPEIFSLRLTRILCFILLPIFILGLFIWL